MVTRTPRLPSRPTLLYYRQDPVPRTPLVEGRIARPLKDLLPIQGIQKADVEAAVRQAEAGLAVDPLWGECRQEMLKSSLAYFASEMISGPPEAPYHGRFLVGRHHEEWDALIHEHEKLVIEAARDHGKSHLMSLAYPIWRGGYTHPGRLGYIFSNTQPLAEAFLALIKEECAENERLQHLLPNGISTARQWGKASELQMRNGSVIRARGMGVKVRGGHPYWAVADDILDDNDIYSETIRQRHIDYFLSAINNMVVPGGQIVVVGTPFAVADLYGYLREAGAYHCVKYPAIRADGSLLFPERYSQRLLDQRKKELNSASRFAREFNCSPLSDESSLFPSHLFEGGDVRVPYTLGLGADFWERRGCTTYTGVDFAMSASSAADYTVIFTVAQDSRGVRWIANIRRGRGWGFQRQLDEIKDEYALMRPAVIHAEANQMQRIFTDELIRETDIPIRKFFTTGVQPKNPSRKGMGQLSLSKHHLERGVPSLRMSLENRKWRIPRGDQRSMELTDIWIGELQSMSWEGGKVVSVGAHDDMCMSSWMCDAAVRMGGFNFSFGDADGTDTAAPLDPSEVTEVDRAMRRADAQVPGEGPPVAPPDTSIPSGLLPQAPESVDNPPRAPYGVPHAPPNPEIRAADDSWMPIQGAPLPGMLGGGGFTGNF
ncbi:MAG: hypothetical protein KJN79_00205 [Gammaproteobacteria bacterium]|nr:hypothetical protein [Gammaproteobacteria bacterium]